MQRFYALAAFLVPLLALSGCSGTTDAPGTDPDTADGNGMNMTAPAPATVVDHGQASADLATARSPYTADFEVMAGHDQMLVSFHVSGVGTYRLLIEDGNGSVVYDSKEQTSTSQPDSHGTSGNDVAADAPSGSYKATVTWQGGITYHLVVITKAHMHAADGGHTHAA